MNLHLKSQRVRIEVQGLVDIADVKMQVADAESIRRTCAQRSPSDKRQQPRHVQRLRPASTFAPNLLGHLGDDLAGLHARGQVFRDTHNQRNSAVLHRAQHDDS